jgi:ABC-type glycerol-3-phosphate transport system permease component
MITGTGSPYTFFNTMLIVSPNGTISIRRKISEDWTIPGCRHGDTCHIAPAKLANDTLRSIPTTNRCGVTLKSLVTICAEVGYRDLIKNLLAANVTENDLHIHSERQGDMQFENLTIAIQTGTWSTTSFEWINFGKYFMNSLLSSSVMKHGSHLIVSEGAYSTAGIVQLSSTPQPVGRYELNADFVFGYLP